MGGDFGEGFASSRMRRRGNPGDDEASFRPNSQDHRADRDIRVRLRLRARRPGPDARPARAGGGEALQRRLALKSERVVLAEDGSAFAAAGARAIIELPPFRGAEVRVVSVVDVPSDAQLKAMTADVLTNNGMVDHRADRDAMSSPLIPTVPGKISKEIKYVVFITKENHTYDTIFDWRSGIIVVILLDLEVDHFLQQLRLIGIFFEDFVQGVVRSLQFRLPDLRQQALLSRVPSRSRVSPLQDCVNAKHHLLPCDP